MTSSIKKIGSVEQLNKIKEQEIKKFDRSPKKRILICTGGGCIASGAIAIKDRLNDLISEKELQAKVEVIGTGCMGPCSMGPVVYLPETDTRFYQVKVEEVESIIDSAFKKKNEMIKDSQADLVDKAYNTNQVKIVLRNSGTISPGSIEDYIRVDGYQAIAKVLTQMSRDEVLEEMKKSGLRGRGGAGFPTWLKWSFAKKEDSIQKYILCNADEGDPGAFMDRSVLEGDPHSLIEGMIVGGYVIGANQGYVYVRAEYPLAVERLSVALSQARQAGLLGENILGSDFSFDLEIRMGSGAFVCGEETALIASIEGKRGEPRPRPPFPAQSGLWGKPTVLNNVETYANVAYIILNGGDGFAKYGTEKSKGTKVFALAGAINLPGLVEIPIGTHLGDLVYDVGGGIPKGKEFKAAQMGGPSGGCVPKDHLDVALDYESLNELGAIMGSGGMIVMDEDSCMVDVARYFLEFVQEESCGKCTPCRVGTKRMLEILERICAGKGEMHDIDLLEELGKQIQDTALCGLGQTAPNPVLSTIRYFRDEYEDHILKRHCVAGVCADLVRASCQSGCPANVDIPGFVSLVGEARYAEALKLHREKNPFAAVCARVCFHPCESKCRRSTLDDPVAIRGVKRFMVDQEITIQVPEVLENEENAKKKIAIIGAGPAGLSCAYFLARMGYKPTVFESEHRPGGMLVQTIPEYRLPRETLAREIRMVENLGVDILTNKKLGKDFTLKSLKESGFEIIFLSMGAPKGTLVDMPGADVQGVTEAIEFLKEYNLRGSVKVGRKVVVVGGGNAAVDAARTATRLGAEVTIVYRRTQSQMPAYQEEIDDAINEGIILKDLTNPVQILSENGKVRAVKCQQMKLGDFDRSGRRRPEKSNYYFDIEADQVIFAVGQETDIPAELEEFGVEMIRGNRIKTSMVTGQTSVDWIFAGGDIVTGPFSVIEAIASGERAAVGIDEFLTGEKHEFWRQDKVVDVFFDPDADPVTYPRKKVEVLDVERRKNNFAEVESSWSEKETFRQAKRCLRCDYGKTSIVETY